MRKFASLLLFFLAISIGLSLTVQPALAAGETYTWDGQNIKVTGGTVGNATIQPNPIAGENKFRGVFQFTTPIRCDITIDVTASADRKTGVIQASSKPGLGPNGSSTPACSPNLVNQFNNTQITIGGNASACGKETDATRSVRIIVSSPDGAGSPANLTFDISDKTGAIKQKAKKDLQDGTAYYETIYQADVGPQKVCASPVLKKCETFEKRCAPLVLTFGDTQLSQKLDVKVNLAVLTQTGQSCKIAGYKAELKKGGTVVQTITTSEGVLQATDDAQNSLGGLTDSKLTLVGSFKGITDGNYQVCLDGQCKDVVKAKGKNVEPTEVVFDVKIQDSSKVCVGIGEDAGTPWPTQPPPPSPPCAKFNDKGGCDSIVTFFGNISTKPGEFITRVFAIILSVSGGIALFLIIRGSYVIMTSRGRPEQLQQGRDQLIAAIVGLLFLIFSFVILEVIGTDILKLPVDDGAKTGTASAPVIHGRGGSCGQGTGASCDTGLTCDTGVCK